MGGRGGGALLMIDDILLPGTSTSGVYFAMLETGVLGKK